MLGYIWIRWKENFCRKETINLSHGYDISMVFSLFELMVRINLKHSWKMSISSILVQNLHMSQLQKVFPF